MYHKKYLKMIKSHEFSHAIAMRAQVHEMFCPFCLLAKTEVRDQYRTGLDWAYKFPDRTGPDA